MPRYVIVPRAARAYSVVDTRRGGLGGDVVAKTWDRFWAEEIAAGLNAREEARIAMREDKG